MNDGTSSAVSDTINRSSDKKLSNQEIQSLIIDQLLVGYDRRIRPFADEKPVIVHCDMYITSFDTIKETTMDYQVTLYFRQYWQDPRLSFNHTQAIVLADELRERFWVPDLFFVNVKQADFHYVTRDNQFFRLHPNGDILYSLRLSLRLSCHMDLRQFPMDIQNCGIQIEPYGYTTNDLLLHWSVEKPVDHDDNMVLAQYKLTGYRITEIDNDWLVTGSFAHIEVHFVLIRELGYYILQTYVPSILLVVVSWVSFWVDVSAAPARVALGITTVLTFTTMSSGVSSQLPKVVYAKAIDVWLATCLIFVFAALLEFALANYLHALGQDRQTLSNFFKGQNKKELADSIDAYDVMETEFNRGSADTILSDDDGLSTKNGIRNGVYTIENDQSARKKFKDFTSKRKNFAQNRRYSRDQRGNVQRRGSNYKLATALAYQKNGIETNLSDSLYAEGMRIKNKAIRIDMISRFLFPLLFLVFNAIYWPMYMTDLIFTRNDTTT
ncbi:glycine receptor alpha 4 subunit-like protein [Saccoglossus kowalevskii]|uniref:Glycine receptor alpha 4 subunit-like protein n=1 Tax=Saccoglossus kowalevskii TaxID=10224 RepID=D1LX32_SACKO|nr:glycine receptor alpha 4 subunit-like protein [Saccoglossus kowalevskii]ACY92538.1 glycine receptor alpha 4 subunit-like protein [Saccoglossus kowalevskii]